MARHSAAFVIEPYLRPSTIRSPLGFMSQATYWAQLLFPGVTVLTRHFFHVELLLRELRRRKKGGHSPQQIRQALRSPTVHRRLEREYNRYRGAEEDAAVTKVTYWQRYGSMFDHFGLWDAQRALHASELWQILFSPRVPAEFRTWVRPEPPRERQRRIQHTRWYLTFQKTLREAQPVDVMWWVTGDGGPREVSDAIKLSRRLSFAFLVWQTLFEVGVQLMLRGRRLPRTSARLTSAHDAVELLVLATEGEPSTEALETIYSGLLSSHANQLGQGMSLWQTEVEHQEWYRPTLTRLYDGTQVKDLAKIPTAVLFSTLVDLHQQYCQAQGKTEAEFIRPSKGGYFPLKAAKISASFRATPWGLFGYRLDQAAMLYQSVQ